MIGNKIKNFRMKNSMTQKDLADKLFVTAQAVSRWENGEVAPSIATVTDMARIFGVTLDELVGNEVEVREPEVIVEKQYVYQEPMRPVLGVCETCNRPIYDANEIVRNESGRGSAPRVFCKECVDKQREASRQAFIYDTDERRKKAYWIGGIISGLWILLTIFVSINSNDSSLILPNVILAIVVFTFISCCILANNFIGEMVVNIFSWGFVSMPGLIFTLDLDGLIWLITVKLLFWVLEIILAIICGIFGVLLGAVLSIFVYPFALVKSYRYE